MIKIRSKREKIRVKLHNFTTEKTDVTSDTTTTDATTGEITTSTKLPTTPPGKLTFILCINDFLV